VDLGSRSRCLDYCSFYFILEVKMSDNEKCLAEKENRRNLNIDGTKVFLKYLEHDFDCLTGGRNVGEKKYNIQSNSHFDILKNKFLKGWALHWIPGTWKMK